MIYARLSCFLLLLVTVGCDDVATTARLEPVREDRITGAWTSLTEKDQDMSIVSDGDGYLIQDPAKQEKPFRFTLGRAQDMLILQSPTECREHEFAVHDATHCYLLYRLVVTDSQLIFYDLNLKRVLRDSDANKLGVSHRIGRRVPKEGQSVTCVLIDAEPADLIEFLARYGKDPGVFHELGRFRRKGA